MISLSYFTDNSTTSSWDSGAFHWGFRESIQSLEGFCEAENPMGGATGYHHFTSRIIPRIIPLVSNWDYNPLISIPDAPWCWNIYLHDWAIFGVSM